MFKDERDFVKFLKIWFLVGGIVSLIVMCINIYQHDTHFINKAIDSAINLFLYFQVKKHL